jgi:putative peptidoglycan lipid II flippase
MLPASLAIIPLSTVLLTDLAVVYQQGTLTDVRQRVKAALRMMLFLTVPVSVMGVLLAEPITRLVYEYGHFKTSDTVLTAQALQIFMIGLPFYGGMHMLSRCFYAIHDTKTPAVVGLFALMINIAVDLLLMKSFSHRGIATGRLAFWLISACVMYIWFQQRCRRLQPGNLSDSQTKP